jgi:prepilin signal peptidase PulO-like enzyme (type II secretory pathway)
VNAAFAAMAAAAATVFYWTIAAEAAGRRRTTIGALPPLLPLVVAVVSALAALSGVHTPAIIAIAAAAVAGVVDARTGSIFDPLTATVLATSLALTALDGSVADGLAGAAAVGGALLFLHALSGGRGLGLGDVKLGAGLGMALGLPGGIAAIALAFIFGGAYGTWLLATKRASPGASIRFGPFIAAGTFAALLTPLGYPA